MYTLWSVQTLTLPGVVFLWVLVLIRGRGALYGGSRRLAAILLALVTILTIRLSFVGQVIDDVTGVPGLQVLVRDSLGIIMSIAAALTVAEVVRVAAVSRVTSRACGAIGTIAIATMAIAFHAAGPARAGVVHMGPESGRPAAFTYWVIYTATYGAFITAVVVLAARDSRRPGPWTRGRRGLVFFALGAACTDVYLSAKLVVLIAARLGEYDHAFVQHATAVQAIPSAIAIVFIVLGAASWTRLHLRARWLHRRLHSSWAALTAPVPAVILDPPLRNPEARLNRRVHEIHEAVALLISHLVHDDAAAARERAGAVPPEMVMVELARLRSARRPLDAAPGTALVRCTLPTSAAALERLLRSRRRALRIAAAIDSTDRVPATR